MKIAIIGYGKMGHIIEKIALRRGHEISCVIDADNVADFDSHEFRKSDVAIEFSTPSTAVNNILSAFAAGVPVVSGTTGWYDSIPGMKELCDTGKGTLLYSSNFSIGVNIFRAVNKFVTKLMNKFPEYTPSMTEVHHIHKLDHPSGTAITLAEDIVEISSRVDKWEEPAPDKDPSDNALEISHVRQGEVPGIHTIEWDSEVDTISYTHSAKSREGFGLGAVLAAEWLKGRRGLFTFADVIGTALD